MDEFNLLSTKLDDVQNHDDFRVVWFSSNNDYPNELTYFVDYLKKYDSFETCNTYIKNFQSERKILLVLIDLFEYISHFNNLPQIQSIYVLEGNCQNVKYEKQKYSKLIDIFMNEHTLIERLRHDILLTYRNDFSITISSLKEIKTQQSLMSLDNNANMLLWNQLFIYYLINVPHVDMNQLKKRMIEQCQLEYQDNEIQLNEINNFANNCSLDNVIEWYTKDSFVYRLVNKAFRKRNVDLIFKFQYFIILLHNKLVDLSIEQQGTIYTTVYRGQILGKNDLDNLQSNIGRLISINSIMSTTRNRNVAQQFICGAKIGVIFMINIVNTDNNMFHPFADISQLSNIQDEEEILFFAGALFRIDSVEKEDNSTWLVKLTLTNEKIDQMKQLLDIVKEQLTSIIGWDDLNTKVDDLILFGKYYKILTQKSISWKDIITDVININIYNLFSVIGDYRKTIEYYKELLSNEKFIDDEKCIVLYIIIGYNYFRLSEYDHALFYYDIALSSLNDNNELTGEIYIHIGDVSRVQDNYDNALSYYEKGLKIFVNLNVDKRDVVKIYRKICDIHQKQNNYEVAFIYKEEADEIDKNYRQRSELDIETSLEYFQNQLNMQLTLPSLQRGHILYSISLCYIKKSDYNQALEKLLKAKELFEEHATSHDNFEQVFTTLFDTLALVYLLLKDNFNALIMLKKSIDIRESFI